MRWRFVYSNFLHVLPHPVAGARPEHERGRCLTTPGRDPGPIGRGKEPWTRDGEYPPQAHRITVSTATGNRARPQPGTPHIKLWESGQTKKKV
jgi:hypothetical protein